MIRQLVLDIARHEPHEREAPVSFYQAEIERDVSVPAPGLRGKRQKVGENDFYTYVGRHVINIPPEYEDVVSLLLEFYDDEAQAIIVDIFTLTWPWENLAKMATPPRYSYVIMRDERANVQAQVFPKNRRSEMKIDNPLQEADLTFGDKAYDIFRSLSFHSTVKKDLLGLFECLLKEGYLARVELLGQ